MFSRTLSHLFLTIALAATASLLPACGGGGGGGRKVAPRLDGTLRAPSLAHMDGVINPLGVSVDTTSLPTVGTFGNTGYDVRWSFFTFDLSELPQGARVTSATLELFQLGGQGKTSLTLPVVVDHLEASGQTPVFSEVANNGLEFPIKNERTGTVLSISRSEARGIRTMDVTRQVQRDVVEGRRLSRFRLRAETTHLEYGVVYFADAENKVNGIPPALVVSYTFN